MRTTRCVPILALGAALAGAAPIAAQSVHGPVLELRPLVGGYVPAGAQRDALGETLAYGAQGAVELAPGRTFVATFVLARPHDLSDAARRRVRLTLLDIGLEWDRRVAILGDWELRPLVGAGLGVRGYAIRSESESERDRTRALLGGYGAIGVELRSGALALRTEARGYVSQFSGLAEDEPSTMRADALLFVGLAWHLR
ncbi:MAG TPA: hypothetical protein VFZ11_11635 [Gemmatimonadaceae bacterium]